MAIGLSVSLEGLQGLSHGWKRCWCSAWTACALLGALQTPLQASETETRHAMAAMAAFAECKVLNAGYSRDRARTILNTWIENKGLEKQAEWLQSPQAIRVVALTSEAMNKSCNGFDQNSSQFIPAMEAIDQL
ncbi:hypothetical protein MITS9509_02561 [Synechococcus sp. MIT S9509]|uniref:hypothetical protein n=1 Tax=unclassified Synechococcus TaxID=2626047 RepID=UPI0007BBBA4A|nr:MULTISPECIES: hypothetical protein [unclassified Synechococcus]KZR85135.1 hypothetical protein MITS9504_02339 [Synechococcus sp. MIT S9504]KZR91332.1 hypothetical protein MITS9509_02561 [Synechococcus sp. MIT S9509]